MGQATKEPVAEQPTAVPDSAGSGGPAEAAQQLVTPEEQPPRAKRRKMLTGMAVVWRYCGLDPDCAPA